MANDMTLAFGTPASPRLDCRPTPVCDPRPVCPACGGLECLCRPRFFAGQLLTEEDLNRLDHYIVAKNRLHNRHLFGTGVVCGLEVVCGVCDPTQRHGRRQAGLRAVALRQRHRRLQGRVGGHLRPDQPCRPRRDDCVEPGLADRAPAEEHHAAQTEEDWVLAICYQETPSRGVTALRGVVVRLRRHGSCGCGGGHSHGSARIQRRVGARRAAGAAAEARKTRADRPAVKAGARPPQCEPTLTCEGYTFRGLQGAA